jgi:hypothetical protein
MIRDRHIVPPRQNGFNLFGTKSLGGTVVSLSHERRRKTTGNNFAFALGELERQTDDNYEYR